MEVSQYENLYTCVQNAIDVTKPMDKIVNFLKWQTKPVTCQEIGIAVFGMEYNHKTMKKSYSRMLGQALRHLRLAGFIKVEKIDGQPIKIPFEELIYTNNDGEISKIRVWDKDGNEYLMPNPKFNPIRGCRYNYAWVTVEKTIIPKINTYLWVAD